MIKADLFRLRKGKGIYIVFGILLSISLLYVFAGVMGTVGLGTNMEELDALSNIVRTGYNTAIFCLQDLSIIQYIILAVMILIVGEDFTNNVKKNTLSRGSSRTKFILSKIVTILLLEIFVCFFYVTISVIGATLVNGFGGEFNLASIWEVLKRLLPQIYIIFSLLCLAMLILVLSKKTTATVFFFIALPMILSLVLMLLNLFPNSANLITALQGFDILSGLTSIATSNYSVEHVIKLLITSTIFVGLGTYFTTAVFKKSDM